MTVLDERSSERVYWDYIPPGIERTVDIVTERISRVHLLTDSSISNFDYILTFTNPI